MDLFIYYSLFNGGSLMFNIIKKKFFILNNIKKKYLIGFIFSFFLTIIPFYFIFQKNFFKPWLIIAILLLCAIIQIFTHLICFLHINNSSEQRWNLISLIFSTLIILILVNGTIWIMIHLNQNLMKY